MPPPAPPPRPFSGVRARGPMLLVVDADDASRAFYAAELATAGFMVLEAIDGASAIEKAQRFGPQAVVLELALPGIDGLKVARLLRGDTRTSGVSVIAVATVTANRPDTLEAMAVAAGCDALMRKPVLGAALVGEIVRVLAARRTHPVTGR